MVLVWFGVDGNGTHMCREARICFGLIVVGERVVWESAMRLRR